MEDCIITRTRYRVSASCFLHIDQEETGDTRSGTGNGRTSDDKWRRFESTPARRRQFTARTASTSHRPPADDNSSPLSRIAAGGFTSGRSEAREARSDVPIAKETRDPRYLFPAGAQGRRSWNSCRQPLGGFLRERSQGKAIGWSMPLPQTELRRCWLRGNDNASPERLPCRNKRRADPLSPATATITSPGAQYYFRE